MSKRLEALAHSKGYRITDDGRLLNPKGRQLSPTPNPEGYPRFRFSKEHTISAHRLAAFQNFGDSIYADGIECRHIDGTRDNFRPSNITLGTHSQNMMDKRPEVRRAAALKAADAIRRHNHGEIIAYYLTTRSQKETREHFGISPSCLHFILNRSEAIKATKEAA